MKSLLKAAAVAFLGLVAVCVSQADTLGTLNLNLLTSVGPVVWDNHDTFYYKFEGATEEGAGKDFLQGAFSNGGLTATVSWDATLFTPDFDFISIKSSTKVLTWDVQTVDWSKYNAFTVTNTLIKNKNQVPQRISHLSIDGTVHEVPDSGATVALLGFGLMLVGLSRRLVVRR